MNNKVELEVIDVSNSHAQIGAYALILGEKEGTRQLPIIIGSAEAQATLICLKGTKTPRPLTHDLFSSCIEVLGGQILRVLIYKVKEGVFYSYIYIKQNSNIIRIDARTSDAIALALRSNAPVYIYESILEKECIRQEEEKYQENQSPDMDKPGTTKVELEQALRKAIADENYELAACIRDEIQKQR